MADINISKFTTQVLRVGSTPSSPGFAVDEGQDPVDPSGNPQTHLPVTIAAAADGFSITDAQVLSGAGTTAQYIRGDGSLASFPSLTGYVPYTGATADVDLGTHDLTAERGTFANNGSSDTLTVNHTSGSGYGIIVTKGGNNEALYVSKTSGSGNAMTVIGGRTSLVDLALSSVTNTAGDFLTISGGVVHKRTAAEVRTDIGAGTVTSVAALTLGTSGTDLSSTVANGTTTPVITLNVPTASATNRGALSSADWSTFNSKQNALTNPVTGTGDNNYVAKFNSTGSTIGNSQIFDNGANVGINTNTPVSATNQTRLTINGFLASGVNLFVNNVNTAFYAASGAGLFVGSVTDVPVFFSTNDDEKMRITSSGTLLVNQKTLSSASAGSKMQVATDMLTTGSLAGYFWENRSGGVTSNSNWYGWYTSAGIVRLYNGSTDILEINGSTGAALFDSSVTATSIIRSGGTSSQYLMADGSVSTLTNPVTGTGVNGRVAFWNGTNTITSDSDLLFNGNTLTLLTGNVEIAAGNGLILFNPNTTNYFQLYTNNGNELNFGFGGTTPVVVKISSSGTMTLTGDIFIQKAAPSVQLRAGNGSNAGFILANSSNTHNWTFESDFGAAGQQGELRIRNSILGSNAINISTSNVVTLTGALNGTSATFSSSVITEGNLITRTTNTPTYSVLLNNIPTNNTTISLISFGARFNSTTYGTGAQIRATAVGTWSSTNYGSDLTFSTVTQNTDVNTERMRITASGNVGINNATPTLLLDIEGQAGQFGSTTAFRTSRFTAKSTVVLDKPGVILGYDTSRGGVIAASTESVGQPLAFWTYNGSSWGERMCVTSSGTLLVNTITLSSAGAGSRMQVATDMLTTGSLAGYFFENRSGGVTASSNWYGWYATGGTIFLYNGSANIASINTSSGAYTALSDKNKKKDFEQSNLGLNEILNLKPTLYRMNSDSEDMQKQLGFLAQEVKEYIPQAYVESEGFIGLNYNSIIPVLVNAIKELKQEINTLKS